MRGKITKNPQFYDRHETNYSRLICQADACTERAAEWMEESEMVPLDRRDSAIATARRLYLYALGCKARAGRMKIGAFSLKGQPLKCLITWLERLYQK